MFDLLVDIRHKTIKNGFPKILHNGSSLNQGFRAGFLCSFIGMIGAEDSEISNMTK